MSNKESTEIKNCINKRANINTTILNFINGENIEKDFSISKYFDNLKTQESGIDFKRILNFMTNIIDNHHRNQEIFSKIEEIFLYFKEEIKQNFSNSEIFNIFLKNKRILYFLFEKNMIIPDDSIIDMLTKPSYNTYFMPVIEMYYTDEPFKDDNQEEREKRKNGENDYKVAQMIRTDSVVEFITFTTQKNYSPNSKISKSHFETNSLLNAKEPTLIEYAAFFGSIQIFRYLIMNKAELTPSIWIYSIHSRNPDLIHILEEYQVELDSKTLERCIIEAIKCHHNDIATYLMDKDDQKKCYFQFFLEYNNYELIPSDSYSYSKCDFGIEQMLDYINYDPILFDLLFRESYLDINKVKNNESLLSTAIKKDNIELIKFLLSNPKINPNIKLQKRFSNRRVENLSLLYMSIDENKTELTKLLLECPNLDPNITNDITSYDKNISINETKTALSAAVESEKIEIIKQLMKLPNIDPNIIVNKRNYVSSYEEKTALSIAIDKGNVEIVEILLSNEKTNPNASFYVNSDKKTELLLLFALEKGNKEIIQLLLNNPKINPNLFINKSRDEKTILSNAIEEENIELIKLLSTCPNIDSNVLHKYVNQDNTYDFKAPLTMAIEKGNTEMVNLLLDYPNIDPNIVLKTNVNHYYNYQFEEKTPLSIAIEIGNNDIIQLLIKNEMINPNIIFKDKYSNEQTILSKAIEDENIELIKLLLSCQNIDIETKINKRIQYKNEIAYENTILQLAIYKKNKSIIQLLFEHKRKKNNK